MSGPGVESFPIPLGPFRLRGTIGRGGMGEVWEGVHAAGGVPVAVKVMAVREAGGDFGRTFRAEAQAAAKLYHPNIIHVFDYGEIDAETERASGLLLTAGSPYLVMELAERGSLKELGTSQGWGEFRGTLLQILDALAHAHARGVVHRDIKPGNLLVAGFDGGAPVLKLSDFGIAHALEAATRAGRFEGQPAGTPHFMSPEQIHGLWRDQGPWTDLYSVGCMAVQLLTGYPPYYKPGSTIVEVVRAHVYAAIPQVRPLIQTPGGLQRWLERLLAKSPRERFQRAADAAWELLRLGDPQGGGYEAPELGMDTIPTPILPLEALKDTRPPLPGIRAGLKVTVSLPAEGWTQSLKLSAEGVSAALQARDEEEEHDKPWPPVPLTWQRPELPRQSMRLVGAGLGLFGVRSVPFVGRRDERTMLWNALRKAARSERGRLLLIRGESGVGKSRLVEWFTERAHEVGAAVVLRASHTQMGARTDGLPRMLARFLQCTGLRREYVLDRVETVLREIAPTAVEDAPALVELMAPALGLEDANDGPRVRFSNAEERYVVVRRLIERLTEERPVVLWLDDLQWGSDVIAFAEHLMRAQRLTPRPILTVGVVRDDVLPGRELEAHQIEELMKLEGAYELELGRLPRDEHRELVQALLGLEGALTAEVAARTDGRPLFAVQLIGDWVERGVLEVGEHGFHLRPGESIRFPDDVYEVVRTRLNAVIRRHGAAGGSQPGAWGAVERAVELAAALGQSVDEEDWRLACRRSGITAPPGLVDDLVRHRLVTRTELGFTFSEVMLLEGLERTSRDAGRWTRHHAVCASALRDRYGEDDPAIAHRLASHLIQAGQLNDALPPLVAAAWQARVGGDFHAAHALLVEALELITELKLPPDDSRRAEVLLHMARTWQDLAELTKADDAIARADAVLEAVRHRDDLNALLLELRGKGCELRGELDAALEHYQRALEVWNALGDPGDLARCLVSLGTASRLRGDLHTARRYFEAALGMLDPDARGELLGLAMSGLGAVLAALRQFAPAEHHLMRAISTFQALGHRVGLASALNALGGMALTQGHYEEAEEFLAHALRLGESIGYRETPEFRVDLGVVQLATGRYADAWRAFDKARAEFEQAGQHGLLGVAHGGLLACSAAARDWDRYDAHAREAFRLLIETGWVHDYLAWVLEHGGDLAMSLGQPHRARRGYELAVSQYQALQMPLNVESVLSKIQTTHMT